MSVACEGILFDGLASRGRNAAVVVEEGTVEVRCDVAAGRYADSSVTLQRSIVGDFAWLRLPDGIAVRIDDSEAIARMAQDLRDPQEWVRAMEARWRYALASLVLVVASAVIAYRVFLPAIADSVSRRMPVAMQDFVGEETLRSIDRTLCKPTQLPQAREDALLSKAYTTVLLGSGPGTEYHIVLRNCPAIGANAFALPSRTIVITDDLVTVAGDDAHVMAVIAHEAGHVENRHVMRMAIQSAGVAVVIATLGNDAFSISTLAAILPTLLLETGYSRAFETEADAYALLRLRETGLSPDLFPQMLERLEADHRKRGEDDEGEQLDYMSTHPATAERIARARAAAAKAPAKP